MQKRRTGEPGPASLASRGAAPPLWLFAFVVIIGTILFVPALPAAALDLRAGSGAVQMTICVFLFGLAVGQLVYSPLSEPMAHGR